MFRRLATRVQPSRTILANEYYINTQFGLAGRSEAKIQLLLPTNEQIAISHSVTLNRLVRNTDE